MGRTPRSELADFAYMVGALTIGFVEAAGGASRHRFCLHAVADTVPALFATAARRSAGCERALRPESQHALPCMQLQPSPRGADTATSAPDTPRSTAARASTGAQHHRTTNKKHRTETRPRALRRSIILPIGERRRGTVPLHQRRRRRRARLRVLQLDGLALSTSNDTDVPRGRTIHLLM